MRHELSHDITIMRAGTVQRFQNSSASIWWSLWDLGGVASRRWRRPCL